MQAANQTALLDAIAAIPTTTTSDITTAVATIIAAIPSAADIEQAMLDDGDGQALIDGFLQFINANLDLPALELTAIANASRDAILNRILSGNHDVAGSPGEALQKIATAEEIADAVLDEPASEHTAAGTIGKLLASLSGVTITVSGSTNAEDVEGDLFIIDGDDYLLVDGRSIAFESEVWPDLTGATVTFRAKRASRVTGTSTYLSSPSSPSIKTYVEQIMLRDVVGEGVLQKISMGLTRIQTALSAGTYFYQIKAELASGSKVSLLMRETGMVVKPSVQDE